MPLPNIRDLYKTPEWHNPAPDIDLTKDVEYPNLNTRDFASRKEPRSFRINESWDCITVNSKQHIALGTNKRKGREWYGDFFGFDQINEGFTVENAIFKLQCSNLICKMKYVSDLILLVALSDGKVQVFSTDSDMRDAKHTVFKIGDKAEHCSPVICMEVFQANSYKAISACMNDTIKIWDMGCADLVSTHTLRNAHYDTIKGITASFEDDQLFATCSMDKTALFWDVRLIRPAFSLITDHKTYFTDICCINGKNKFADLIFVSDCDGFVHSIDRRVPNKFLRSEHYINNDPVYKLCANGEKMAVIGSRSVQIISMDEQNIIYDDFSTTRGYVNDTAWIDSDTLLSVGSDAKLHMHRIKLFYIPEDD